MDGIRRNSYSGRSGDAGPHRRPRDRGQELSQHGRDIRRGRPTQRTTYLLDGSSHNDVLNGLTVPLPFPDALQEFKVETSALPAQYGQHSAAAVNAVTKSGTNEIHGDAFEFLRNGVFNARDFFATSRDTLKRNQFGGTIGGPIKRDKMFFFGGY